MHHSKIDELLSISQDIRVLYIDDDDDTRNTMMLVLENFFKNITLADNGQSGLDKFKDSYFDIVLTDINMPLMNGLEMIKEIKNLNKKTSILVLSASNEPENLQNIEEVGVDGYLLKPINLDKIVHVLIETIYNLKKQNKKKI